MSNKKRTLIVRIICIIIVAIMVLGICVSTRAYETDGELSVSSEETEEISSRSISESMETSEESVSEEEEALSEEADGEEITVESSEISEEEALLIETEDTENLIDPVLPENHMAQTETEMSITEAAVQELVKEFDGSKEETTADEVTEAEAAEADLTAGTENAEDIAVEAETPALEEENSEEAETPSQENVINEEAEIPALEIVTGDEPEAPIQDVVFEAAALEESVPEAEAPVMEITPEEGAEGTEEPVPEEAAKASPDAETEAPGQMMLMMLPGIDIIGDGTEKTEDEPSKDKEKEQGKEEVPGDNKEETPAPVIPEEKEDSGNSGNNTPEPQKEAKDKKDVNGRDIPNTGDSNSRVIYIACMSASFTVMLFAAYLIVLNKRIIKKAAYAREREEFRRKYKHKE